MPGSNDPSGIAPAPALARPAGRPATPWLSWRGGPAGFVLRFLLFWIAAVALTSQIRGLDGACIRATVWNLGWILRLAGQHPAASGDEVMTSWAQIRIVPDCTSLMPTLALWAAIAAFPARWPRRLAGWALGAALVWLFNQARVLALMGVLAVAPGRFELAHVYLWQTGTLLIVLLAFVIWVRAAAPAPRPGAPR